MKSLGLLLIATISLSICSFAKTIKHKSFVHFNTSEYQLDKKAKNQLDEILRNSLLNPDFEIFIDGHTDNRGSIAYNNQLSLNRSEAVKTYLIEHGVSEKLINMGFKGELDPELPNINPQNMEMNRRVEVTFTSYQFKDISELENELSPSIYQSITIDPSVENLVKGKNGVQVLIPENAFRKANGELVTEEVKLELTEALSFKDFISSGLECKSDGEILESGGMVNLSAQTINGEEVSIADKQEIILAIPNKNRQDDMEVFVSESGDNWTSTNRAITNEADAITSFRSIPKLKSRKIPFPKFHYGVDKPNAPKVPKKMRHPHEPKKESYERHIPWYKFNKDKIRKHNESNYEKALGRYDDLMDRYEKQLCSYEKKMNEYENCYIAYEADVQIWEENKQMAINEFKLSPDYLAAVEKQNKVCDFYLKKYQEELKQWRLERGEAAVKWGEKMDRMGMTSEESMNNYVFAINKLSWINCDRFYNVDPIDRHSVVLASNDVANEKVLILFKDIRSMLSCNPNLEENTFTLANFPQKEAAFVFAYKVVNQRPMICFIPMDGSSDYKLQYEQSSFNEIKEILAQFESS